MRLPTDAAGFTLVEMLVALAGSSVVLAGALVVLQIALFSSSTSASRAEAQANARAAVQRMIPDIREAGYNPTNATFTAFLNPTSTSMTLQSDRDGSGAITTLPAGTCDATAAGEQVRYQLSGTQLMRSVNTASASCETAILGGVQALSFTYHDSTGATTAVAANIRSVAISVTALPETSGYNNNQPIKATVTERIRIRNR